MASSTLSLDSLSSPSPSPSRHNPRPQIKWPFHLRMPPPQVLPSSRIRSFQNLQTTTRTGQHQWTEESIQHRPSPLLHPKRLQAPVSSLVDEGVNAPYSSSTALNRPPTTAKRGSHQRNSSTSRRGGARKKRSSIVPAPM